MSTEASRAALGSVRQPVAATTKPRSTKPSPGTRKGRRTTSRIGTTAGVGGDDGKTPSVGAAPFPETLCARHQGWVTNEVREDRLPRGWRVLVEQTFAEIATVVGDRRYLLRRLEKEGTGLIIALVPTSDALTATSAEPPRVRHLVDCARIASRRLCQVCGGMVRPEPELGAQPLCTAHARDFAALLVGAPNDDAVSTTGRDDRRKPCREGGRGPMTTPTRVQLYRPSDVAAAIDPHSDDPDEAGETPTTEHAGRLRRILQRGETASWRSLVVPTHDQCAALDDLDRRAPHFRQVTELVRRHVAAAIAMGVALTLPALMLVGEPGLGKTWYVSRLAAALGLPVRTLAMNASSLGDSLTGAFPVWRNAREGLVARTLLAEAVMNPVFLVDEIDKAAAYNNEDPYRPYYTVLEPENARSLIDDYLGFPMDASHASWVLAGNTVQNLPAPILDRLLVLSIPDMDDAQRRIVADSVYAEVNAVRNGYFDPQLSDGVADRLASLTARGMRRALGDAMVRAAAAGRRSVLPGDVATDPAPCRRRIGFGPWR